jgi:cytochrome P450
MDEINSLEYMDSVVREILRLESPVSLTIRTSARDDIVPLGKPVKSRQGTMMSSCPVKRGTPIMIPIVAVNRDPAVWGEDADEFYPDRWSKENIGAGVGVYSRMLTFLAG